MANNNSAKKRIQVGRRNRLQNKYYKTSVRSLIKHFFHSLELYKTSKTESQKQELQNTLNLIYSFLDKGTKRNVFHKNMAARQKARLANHLKIIFQ